ncbi:hypothetical protein MHBO_001217 [Bonamia ostreae]|uniref:Uncharacterized protein n=1 Tax=Bonamia ostreae TaxID=126728 RepID=A0ABV2AJF6_9EUKA
MFEAKKEHLQKLNSLFAEAKTKRKQNKAPRKTYSDTKAFPKKTPKMGFKFGEKHLEKNPDLLYSATSTCFSFDSAELASLDSDGETEDEKIAPLSFSVTVNDEHIYIPQKQNYAAFDISNDGFAIVPEFQEVLPKEDAQSVVLSKKSFQHRDNRFRNLKKRKAVSLVVDTLFHKWDSNYVSDNV